MRVVGMHGLAQLVGALAVQRGQLCAKRVDALLRQPAQVVVQVHRPRLKRRQATQPHACPYNTLLMRCLLRLPKQA